MGKTISQRVFITGGASGLGKAIAVRYAKAGAKICIGDINAERGTEAVAEIQAAGAAEVHYIHCDVTKMDDFEAARDFVVATWQGIDIVVNNAGVATAGGIDADDLDDWAWVININLMGVVRGCKTFTPVFKEQKSGHFVNIASMAGLISPPMMGSYNAVKAAVVSVTETIDAELSGYNVRATAVCPSFFRTNLDESMRSHVPGMDKVLEKLFANSPITAEDVANDVFDGVKKKALHVVPHRESRKVWRIKRFLPNVFRKQVVKSAQRMMKR